MEKIQGFQIQQPSSKAIMFRLDFRDSTEILKTGPHCGAHAAPPR